MDQTQAQTRPRGRPAVLSREVIVRAALKHLRRGAASDLSIAEVARELAVSPPAISRYFSSRTALLEAMSVAVFAEFPILPADGDWRRLLLSWQLHVVALFRRHPGILSLMAWDGHIAGPWLQVQMPVIKVLHDLGLRRKRLVETSTWFLAGSVGLIRTVLISDMQPVDRSDRLDLTPGVDHLDAADRALLQETAPWIGRSSAERILSRGFEALIDGVARELRIAGHDAGASKP
jgi:TetR/AcrR family transcriptional regulator, tetracycline repressor protein